MMQRKGLLIPKACQGPCHFKNFVSVKLAYQYCAIPSTLTGGIYLLRLNQSINYSKEKSFSLNDHGSTTSWDHMSMTNAASSERSTQ